MKSASDLTNEQKKTVFKWAEDGATLQDIQDRLDEEFGIRFTFMETRFLAGDLELPIKSEVKAEPEKAEEPSPDESDQPEGGESEVPDLAPDTPDDTGATPPTVTVDQIAIPGTLISGKATFSGGKVAMWSLDQFGRLSLNPDDPDFRPSESEVMAFQQELQRVAQKQGF